ncbi:MAG: hypothetical protein PVF68_06145 [Acidobacteriota bacterium]|jgi:predicted hotdog family 3-hydroxylacyl-ACP dehydratase
MPFPDPRELLPHSGSMALLREVLEGDETSLTCAATIGGASPLADPGGAPAMVALELAAQAAAAHHAGRASGSGPGGAVEGYLVRARDVRLRVRRLPADRPLQVEVRLEGSAPPLAMYCFTVRAGDEEMAAGRISTWSA